MKIAILLSTYNGERYLAEQLDSLLAQDYADWHLYVRDDGSKDKTVAIIADYAKRDARITLLEVGKNIGVKASFEYLLEAVSDAEYLMFCDQDDVWFKQKVSKTLAAMQATEKEYGAVPIVVHSDAVVVNEQLEEIAPSYWKYGNVRPDLVDNKKEYLAIANSLTGCTLMLNKQAREVALPFYKDAYIHDAWVGLTTLANGGVIVPITEPQLLYRQHGGNTLGAIKYRFTLGDWGTKYRLARQCYLQSNPLIYSNVWAFLYQKIRYIINRM